MALTVFLSHSWKNTPAMITSRSTTSRTRNRSLPRSSKSGPGIDSPALEVLACPVRDSNPETCGLRSRCSAVALTGPECEALAALALAVAPAQDTRLDDGGIPESHHALMQQFADVTIAFASHGTEAAQACPASRAFPFDAPAIPAGSVGDCSRRQLVPRPAPAGIPVPHVRHPGLEPRTCRLRAGYSAIELVAQDSAAALAAAVSPVHFPMGQEMYFVYHPADRVKAG